LFLADKPKGKKRHSTGKKERTGVLEEGKKSRSRGKTASALKNQKGEDRESGTSSLENSKKVRKG